MEFEIKGKNFIRDGRKVFLNSGEIHYFRIFREHWDYHLKAAVEAGLDTVSTYIPWAWHEPEEGVFDFDGSTCNERDLKGWLQRCQAHGLNCIVKPGPFILAELRGAGLPDWFLEKQGESVRMRDRVGNLVRSDGVNLFHEKYLEKVGLWYDQVIAVIREQQSSSGGPVIMMQVCNEIGVFSWLAHQADYGNNVKERFIGYIRDKYKDISILNRCWDTAYPGFEELGLPPDGSMPYASGADRARDHDWHYFWRKYYADYLKLLTGMIRSRGITVPLYHNLPGWIYGNGYEFPVNITMYEGLFGDRSELLFGLDHIPEFVSYRNMHDDRIINDITRAMQGEKPLFAAEFQCGSREYHVVTNPRELELFYKAGIANGLTGWNYYMFSQGRNRRGMGYSGGTFYWYTPMTAESSAQSTFPLVKKMSSIVKVAQKIIVDARRRAEVCILFYPPYYATELERPETGASRLHYTAAAIRRPAYFDGLLKVFQLLNIDYDMMNLVEADAEKLSHYKQVWAFSTEEMDAGDQQALADYMSTGGQLVLFPCLPDREMSQQCCTLISDALGIKPSGVEITDSPLIDLYGNEDIKCANPVMVYDADALQGAEVIARTLKGNVCGFRKNLGMGCCFHLGTWLGFDTEDHKYVYETILNKSKAKLRHATTDSKDLIVRERFTGDGSALLFVANYYNEDHRGRIIYTHPVHGEAIRMPYQGEEALWPALYGVLSPLCLEITDGISLLHSTSDILGVTVQQGMFAITLTGDRDMAGEAVFEGEQLHRLKNSYVDGEEVAMVEHKGRIVVHYPHQRGKDMVLTVFFNDRD
jgi:beta-galactosidase